MEQVHSIICTYAVHLPPNWNATNNTLGKIYWCCLSLFNGAGYYSYLYARCLASTVWHEVCHDDPLSFSTGSAIRSFLKHGGAKEPAVLLKELGGDGILRYHDSGGIIPDITSLCRELRLWYLVLKFSNSSWNIEMCVFHPFPLLMYFLLKCNSRIIFYRAWSYKTLRS